MRSAISAEMRQELALNCVEIAQSLNLDISAEKLMERQAQAQNQAIRNKEMHNTCNKWYYAKNKEKICERLRRRNARRKYKKSKSALVSKYYAEHRKECIKSQRKYYAQHREEILAKRKQSYADSKASGSTYYAQHHEEILAKNKQRYADGKAKVNKSSLN